MPATYDATPPVTLSSSASRASVAIGDSSFSPGDVFVESVLPKVRLNPSPSPSKPGSRDSTCSNQDLEVLPLADHPSVLRAQAECATLLNGNDVAVLEDEDVKEPVVQITGRDAELAFPCRSIFRYLVLFLKDMEHFVALHVAVLDDQQVYRRLTITNARSLAKVEPSSAQLPLVLGAAPGWRYVCLDLHDLTRRAFGSKHVTTTQLRVLGRCRLLRVFFQDELYADAALPPHLTFLG